MLWFFAAVATADSGAIAPPDRPMPPAGDFTVQTLADAAPVRLSDYTGRVVLLNFWASWCYPCRYEMAAFQKLQAALHDEGFTVLAVAVYDDVEEARKFQQKYHISVPLMFDRDGQAKDAFDIKVVPQTLLLSRDQTLIPIPDPKTHTSSWIVNDPTIWEHPDTLKFLRRIVRQ